MFQDVLWCQCFSESVCHETQSVWAGLMEVKDVGSLMTDLLMSCSFSSLWGWKPPHRLITLCSFSLFIITAMILFKLYVRDQDHSLQRHFSHQTFDMQESIRWSYSLFSFQIIHIFLRKSVCSLFTFFVSISRVL